MSMRRVVVTGMGMVTPLGNNVADTWQALLAGKSGVAPVADWDAANFATRFAAQVKDFSVEGYLNPKEARRNDIFIQYGLVAALQAVREAGIEVTEQNAPRIGAAIGSGIGGLTNIEETVLTLHSQGPRKISPFFVPGTIVNMIAGNLAILCGFKGPNLAVTTACTTGTHCIGLAAQQIQLGIADVMVAGGAEKASTPLGIGGFCAARALSSRNDDPERASRPWDKDRDGFVLGDGAGALVLEEYEHARKRGATIYGEVIGFGMSDDAFHMTSPPEDGAGAAMSMRNALLNAKLNPEDIHYINAHGTSTPAGDVAEARAVKGVFGAHAHRLAVSSTKSMHGHLLGAAGAIEAIITLLSIRDQVAPPTINLDNPDTDCDLDFVPKTARSMRIEAALSNSFGFGGTNGSLIFRRV
ncbi:MAG: beta-ketoacyl-ACP synthase II [Pseudomonadota bacterium]